MNPHQPTPIGVSVAEATRLTSVSDKEIRDAVNAGEIPAFRRGRRIVIDYAGLSNWLRSHPPVVEQSTKSA